MITGCQKTPEPEKTWELAPEGVFSAALSQDGRYALLGSTGGKAVLWDLSKTKSPLHVWQHEENSPAGIVAVALSPDHKFALTAERNSLAWWDTTSGQTLGFWPIPDIHSVSISSDGQKALIGLRDQAFYFSLQKGTYLFTLPHPGFVYATDLSADGRYALTGSDENDAKLWSLKTGEIKQTWKHKTKLYTVALSPNGKFALTNAASGATRLWSTGTGKAIHSLPPERITITAAAFSPKNNFLVTGRTTQRIDLWNTKKGVNTKFWQPKKSHSWRPSAATILAIEFTHKGQRIISVTSNGIVQRWKVK